MMRSEVRYNAFSDEHYIIIPYDIVELLDLQIGDTLEWCIQDDKVYIKKQQAAK